MIGRQGGSRAKEDHEEISSSSDEETGDKNPSLKPRLKRVSRKAEKTTGMPRSCVFVSAFDVFEDSEGEPIPSGNKYVLQPKGERKYPNCIDERDKSKNKLDRREIFCEVPLFTSEKVDNDRRTRGIGAYLAHDRVHKKTSLEEAEIISLYTFKVPFLRGYNSNRRDSQQL